MKRVALIDDHGLVRAGLRALVQDQPGYEVVAEGADGSEAFFPASSQTSCCWTSA